MHGQLLILGVPGTELTPEDAAVFKKIQPGGYVLFGRNVQSPEQLRKLTDDLRDLSDVTPIISIDQEGGRVTRTRDIGAQPPSAQELREKGEIKYIEKHGVLTAEILRLLGFNMNLCPVLDISYDDEADNSLKGRCYGSDAQEVINNAGVFNRNMRHYQIMSCGKHFPSCGLADKDPHHDLPYVDKSVEDMLKSDLLPYTALMSELNALMTCHTHFSAIDPDTPGLPGSMSHNLITGLMRNQLGYEGVIMTDDLDMGAILNTYGRGPDVKNSIMAGNDMAMICHQIDTAEIAMKHLQELPIGNVDDSLKRIHKLKKGFKKIWPYSEKLWKDINADILKLRVDVLGEERAHEVIDYTGETRSPVEDY